MEIRLPNTVKKAIDLLEAAGFEAYCVGGALRDFFLHTEPKDFDLATNATPEQMETVFFDFHCIRTGIRHDTITVHIEEDYIEITTYRYSSTSIHGDLSYRDFTINSMAYSPSKGLVDPFHGLQDLQNHILRFTGSAVKRIQEDPLRMMRIVRLSCHLHFSILEEDYREIQKYAYLLPRASKERIREELTKILMSGSCGIEKLYEAGLLKTIEPCLNELFSCAQNNPYHYTDVGHHTLDTLRYLDTLIDDNKVALSQWEERTIRYTLLLHDVGKLETKTTDEKGVDHFYHHPQSSVHMARSFLEKYRFSKQETQRILTLIEYHDYHLSLNQKGLRKILLKHRLYPEIMHPLLIVKLCDAKAHTHPEEMIERILSFEKMYNEFTDTKPYKISDLSIDGNRILKLCPGLDPVNIPLIQKECLDLVFYQPEKNTNEFLSRFVEKNKSRYLHM